MEVYNINTPHLPKNKFQQSWKIQQEEPQIEIMNLPWMKVN